MIIHLPPPSILTRLAKAIRVFRLLGKGGSIIERMPCDAAASAKARDDLIRHLRNLSSRGGVESRHAPERKRPDKSEAPARPPLHMSSSVLGNCGEVRLGKRQAGVAPGPRETIRRRGVQALFRCGESEPAVTLASSAADPFPTRPGRDAKHTNGRGASSLMLGAT